MKVFMTSDHHIKHEEPFFQAGVALDNWILERLVQERDKFVYLDGGDRFHTSISSGRVNGEVVRFFVELCALPNCQAAVVIQGNHDVKTDTGSALDVLRNLNRKIKIVDEPMIGEGAMQGFYLLPYMRPYSMPGYIRIKTYGDEQCRLFDWFGID